MWDFTIHGQNNYSEILNNIIFQMYENLFFSIWKLILKKDNESWKTITFPTNNIFFENYIISIFNRLNSKKI